MTFRQQLKYLSLPRRQDCSRLPVLISYAAMDLGYPGLDQSQKQEERQRG